MGRQCLASDNLSGMTDTLNARSRGAGNHPLFYFQKHYAEARRGIPQKLASPTYDGRRKYPRTGTRHLKVVIYPKHENPQKTPLILRSNCDLKWGFLDCNPKRVTFAHTRGNTHKVTQICNKCQVLIQNP